jgi:predicted acylesterase/phospholipase RssA
MNTNNLKKTLTPFLLFVFVTFASQANGRTVTVLSIDGGGIRGIIPAMVLKEIETRIGMPISSAFDEIVGTSTGGIIALGLSAATSNGAPMYAVDDLLELYETQGNVIFQSSLFRKGIFRSRYNHVGLERLLLEKFGNLTLSDTRTKVAVTSYDMEHAKPFIFSSERARANDNDNFFMKDAARATSAAPTYFAPAEIYSQADTDKDFPLHLIDGGVIANNPALLGYTIAHTDFPEADEFIVVSIGTGDGRRSLQRKSIGDGGALFWASPIISLMMSGVSYMNDQMMQFLYPETNGSTPNRYYRFQIPLAPELEPMDETSRPHIESLKGLGNEMIRTYSHEIDELVKTIQTLKGSHPSSDSREAEKILSAG